MSKTDSDKHLGDTSSDEATEALTVSTAPALAPGIGFDQTSDTVASKGVQHAEIPPGSRVDRYLILGHLGVGGMGTVYAAYDPELDRKVALKFLFEQETRGSAARAAVLREGQSMARLAHSNVCSVYDVGDYKGRIFFAMEHIEGQTLRKWLKNSKPDWKQIVETLVGVGRGLSAAHVAGIIHRDLKPANILVEESGRGLVTDFGIAALEKETSAGNSNSDNVNDDLLDSSEFMPGSHTTAGTPPYMSPEQHLGGSIDARSDQFGFCATLFVALYGFRPFVGESAEAVRASILEDRPVSPPAETKVPRWLHKVILRGLERRPEDRFESMDSLLRGLSLQRRARFHQAGLMAIVAVASLALVAWISSTHATNEARRALECQGAEIELSGTWNPQHAAKAKDKFAESGVSHHEDTWRRAGEGLGRYSQEWAAMHTKTCTATRIHKERSEAMLDLGMACLARRKKRLSLLVSAFEEADKKVVTNAVAAVQSLPLISACGDLDALSRTLAPPETEELRRKVDLLNEKIDGLETLESLGKIKLARARAETIAKEAREVEHYPVQAEALYWLAYYQVRGRDSDSAEATLKQARWAAEASSHDKLAAEIANLSVFIATDLKGDHEEAKARAHWANAALKRYGVEDSVVGTYEMSLGTIAHRTGNLDGALEHYSKSLQIQTSIYGSRSIVVAKSLNNIALAYFKLGRYEESLKHHRASLKIKREVLGPTHPDIGNSLNNMGEVFRLQGNLDEAANQFRDTHAVWLSALGDSHPNVGFPLHNLAEVFLEQRKFEDAIGSFQQALTLWKTVLGEEHSLCAAPLTGIGEAKLLQGKSEEALVVLQRALEIREAMKGEPAEIGRTRFALAETLHKLGRRAEALPLAKQALLDLKQAGETEEKRLQAVTSWLAGPGKL